ncbi:MAG TPA: FAD-dependent oxidoreductase [Gemmatimonadales bacterium]|nr:FAD-dependent oxidoreductase [Gemmatimonadales bacterium]
MQIAVVGGGISGLTAAMELANGSCSVSVLEASGRFGGQVATERRDGFVIELGAEGFVARSSAVPELCRRAGLDAELLAQATRRAFMWRHDRLVELREGEAAELLGIPLAAEDVGRGLLTLPGGMGELVDALVETLSRRVKLRAGALVTGLRRRGEGAAWRLDCADGESLEADAVIVALPPRHAEPLLAPLVGTAELNAQICYGSTVTVTLAYARGAVAHPLDAGGFVVDGPGPEGLRACSFSSSKFSGRAPAGQCLLRAFFTPGTGTIEENEQSWSERAHRTLAPILGLRGPPDASWVRAWPAALPRYLAGHREAVVRVRRSLHRLGRIECAGSGFDGGGIDGAVRSGLAAARRVVAGPAKLLKEA